MQAMPGVHRRLASACAEHSEQASFASKKRDVRSLNFLEFN
jgi:hypothetical protein